MRVLLVCQEFPRERGSGGIGAYVRTIAPALARLGAEVHLLAVALGLDPSSAQTPDGVHEHRRPLRRPRGVGRLTGLPAVWERVALARGVAREARSLGLDFDVVECPDWGAEGLFLAGRRSHALVARSHGSAGQVLPFQRRMGVDARLAVRLEDSVLRRADLVTGTAAQLAEEGPRIGLDPARTRAITYPVEAPGAPAVEPDPLLISFAGRFERRKGPQTIVAALPAVRAAVPGARAELAGMDTNDAEHGPFAQHLRTTAEQLGVGDAVVVAERWGRDAVVDVVSRSLVCAVPSHLESFGYVAAEAGALGRAVVASAIPPIAEIVRDGETGFLVAPDDVDAWADALTRLLSDPALAAKMGENARRHVSETFGPEQVATQTLEAYEAAVERRRSRAGSGAGNGGASR